MASILTNRYRLYVGSVLAVGLVLLALISRDVQSVNQYIHSPANLILWMAMICIASMSPVPIPRGGATVSVTPALDFAAILVFGPAIAAWFSVLARIITNMSDRWNPLPKAMLTLGHAVIATSVAGVVYSQLGGRVGNELFVGKGQVLTILAAGVVYWLIKSAILATAEVLNTGTPSLSDWRALRGVFFYDLFVLPAGFLLALTQLEIGQVGVAIFLIPLLLVRYVFKFWIETKHAHIETVRTLMSAVDASDPFTRGHSYRIAKISVCVAKRMGLPEKDLEELEYAALLHDIGRTAIQRDILIKPGKLTEREQTVLRTHPKIGYDILKRLKFFEGAADIVHSHHEQVDGNGYPRGLSGEDVPVASRIIMAVAALDAMTSDRPYRRGLPMEAAFDELLAHTGTQFYSEVVQTMIQLYTQGALFDEFEESEFGQYTSGQSNSRALESHLMKKGIIATVPEKLGMEPASSVSYDDDVPEIELPDILEERLMARKEFDLLPDGKMKITAAGLSDMGCVRGNNEDSFGLFSDGNLSRGCLLVVADGMGGAAAGEVASKLAVETLHGAYFAAETGIAGVDDVLHEAIHLANEVIHSTASSDRKLGGMGTTCTAAVVVGMNLVLGHVGDSRAYLVRNESIQMLTRDHTLAAELAQLVGANGIAPDGSENVLTRCLGSEAKVEVDLSQEPYLLQENDAVVICSDGLSNLVNEEEILENVSRRVPDESCRELVELARERGGHDNITVLVARVVRG